LTLGPPDDAWQAIRWETSAARLLYYQHQIDPVLQNETVLRYIWRHIIERDFSDVQTGEVPWTIRCILADYDWPQSSAMAVEFYTAATRALGTKWCRVLEKWPSRRQHQTHPLQFPDEPPYVIDPHQRVMYNRRVGASSFATAVYGDAALYRRSRLEFLPPLKLISLVSYGGHIRPVAVLNSDLMQETGGELVEMGAVHVLFLFIFVAETNVS